VIAPVITTERLALRPYRFEDFERLAALYQTERSRHIGGPLPAGKVWLGFMNGIGQWPIRGMGTWAVALTGTSDTIGEVGVTHPVDYPECELGWLLFEGWEGNGYAEEAARAAMQYALEVLHVASLVSYVDPDNRRSIRLAERLGGQLDVSAATPNGDPCLVYRYRIPG
jgi:RimJ/RimL family protein N-acetyltransferase